MIWFGRLQYGLITFSLIGLNWIWFDILNENLFSYSLTAKIFVPALIFSVGTWALWGGGRTFRDSKWNLILFPVAAIFSFLWIRTEHYLIGTLGLILGNFFGCKLLAWAQRHIRFKNFEMHQFIPLILSGVIWVWVLYLFPDFLITRGMLYVVSGCSVLAALILVIPFKPDQKEGEEEVEVSSINWSDLRVIFSAIMLFGFMATMISACDWFSSQLGSRFGYYTPINHIIALITGIISCASWSCVTRKLEKIGSHSILLSLLVFTASFISVLAVFCYKNTPVLGDAIRMVVGFGFGQTTFVQIAFASMTIGPTLFICFWILSWMLTNVVSITFDSHRMMGVAFISVPLFFLVIQEVLIPLIGWTWILVGLPQIILLVLPQITRTSFVSAILISGFSLILLTSMSPMRDNTEGGYKTTFSEFPNGTLQTVNSSDSTRVVWNGDGLIDESTYFNKLMLPQTLISSPGAGSILGFPGFIESSRHFDTPDWKWNRFDIALDSRKVILPHDTQDLVVINVEAPLASVWDKLLSGHSINGIKNSLTPHGILCLWWPVTEMPLSLTKTIAHSLVNQFSHTHVFILFSDLYPEKFVIGFFCSDYPIQYPTIDQLNVRHSELLSQIPSTTNTGGSKHWTASALGDDQWLRSSKLKNVSVANPNRFIPSKKVLEDTSPMHEILDWISKDWTFGFQVVQADSLQAENRELWIQRQNVTYSFIKALKSQNESFYNLAAELYLQILRVDSSFIPAQNSLKNLQDDVLVPFPDISDRISEILEQEEWIQKSE